MNFNAVNDKCFIDCDGILWWRQRQRHNGQCQHDTDRRFDCSGLCRRSERSGLPSQEQEHTPGRHTDRFGDIFFTSLFYTCQDVKCGNVLLTAAGACKLGLKGKCSTHCCLKGKLGFIMLLTRISSLHALFASQYQLTSECLRNSTILFLKSAPLLAPHFGWLPKSSKKTITTPRLDNGIWYLQRSSTIGH